MIRLLYASVVVEGLCQGRERAHALVDRLGMPLARPDSFHIFSNTPRTLNKPHVNSRVNRDASSCRLAHGITLYKAINVEAAQTATLPDSANDQQRSQHLGNRRLNNQTHLVGTTLRQQAENPSYTGILRDDRQLALPAA